MINIVQIAKVCHAANMMYCDTLGDFSQPNWDAAPDWQKESAINGVAATIYGEANTPEEQHELWMKEKIANGWKYGAVKDEQAKTHPCLVDYNDLPEEQKLKDKLFRAIVQSFITNY